MSQDATNIANTFQHPNWNIDQLMYLLTPEENTALTFITRHILGWQKERLTRRKTISYSMMVNGYADEDGNVYHGTGLGNSAARNASKSLVKYGIVVLHGVSNDGQEYELPAKPKIDWQGLTQRREERIEKENQRTQKATESRLNRKVVTLDVGGNVGRGEGGNVGRGEVVTLDNKNQTHQTHTNPLSPLTLAKTRRASPLNPKKSVILNASKTLYLMPFVIIFILAVVYPVE